MIKLKQNNQKWRIEISEEEFQFDSREEFDKTVKILCDLKENNGQLNKFNRREE